MLGPGTSRGARVEMCKLSFEVDGKLDVGSVDPGILGVNQALEDAIADMNERTASLPEE